MLQWFLRRLYREQKGFTLIELMVVAAILAVLAFLVVPRVLEALNRSKLNSGVSVANEIASAFERYAAQNGEASKVQYPGALATWNDMVSTLGSVATIPDESAASKYFDFDTQAFAYNVSTNLDNYLIELTSTDNAGTKICIKPGGVQTNLNADGTANAAYSCDPTTL